MPLPIDVKPYVLNNILGGDNYLTHYKASKDGETYVITEFYPAYMVKREDDGTLGVSERFAKEFVADRDEFVRRAEGFRDIRDASLHPVVEIFEKNHTAYIVRRTCSLTTIDQYMGSMTMDFDEAYYFIRPLILSMAQLANKGLLLNVSPGDFRVNSFKQVVLCSPPSWDTDFHLPLIQIAKIYYRLVTGIEASDQGAAAFSAYGIPVPKRIETFIMEILGGDILYGSLDDFYKKFKSLIDGMAVSDDESDKRTLSVMRGIVAVLFVLFVISLAGLAYGGVRMHRSNSSWANPDIFADSAALPLPAHDFSAITLTHPRNPADALTGSFAEHEGFLFFRGEGGMKSRLYADIIFVPGAMGMSALAEDRLIVPGAVPSYIVGHGNHVYFVDSASGGMIYRVTVTGAELTRITQHAALNLAVIGDTLFYTNVSDNYSLWHLDVETGASARAFDRPVIATLAFESHLFFISANEAGTGTSLYSWDLAADRRLLISTEAAGGLRVLPNFREDILFFLDVNGRIRSITFDGRQVQAHSPENVRTFDVFFQWLFFTEEGVHVPRAYNMDSSRFFTLSNTEWVSYMRVHDNMVYAIDHTNPSLVHNFSLPTS